jgi:hypothetical protein
LLSLQEKYRYSRAKTLAAGGHYFPKRAFVYKEKTLENQPPVSFPQRLHKPGPDSRCRENDPAAIAEKICGSR